MKYRTLLLAAGLIALAACSKDEPQQVELACNDPEVSLSLQQQLRDLVSQTARQFAQNDSRQFVDADKVLAAASQLGVTLQEAKTDTVNGLTACSARLEITIPDAVWQLAQENTPLLYPNQNLPALLQQQLTGSPLQLNGSTFSQALRYVPPGSTASDSGKRLQLEAPGIAQLGHTLTNALMPYGVKDLLVINGKAYNRADALRYLNNPPPPAASEPPLSPEAAEASAILNGATTPETPPEPEIDPQQLHSARQQNRAANNTINALWQEMDGTVRASLQDEQRQWVNQKQSRCAEAALAGRSASEREYLSLGCDTRMTQERTEYLRGFSSN